MSKFIIFANGHFSQQKRCQQYISKKDVIICANGGTLNALKLGIFPNIIVGDMDSLPDSIVNDMKAEGVEIIRHPVKKDKTDLELALATAIKHGAKEILLLTVLGGRLDQQMANIMLLTRPEWQSARLGLVQDNQRAWLLRGPDEITLAGKPGDTLSLVPLCTLLKGIDISGAEWPMQNGEVKMGSTHTISNSFSGNEVTVKIQSGVGLVIHIQQS